MNNKERELTPQEVMQKLNEHVIGQEEAKRSIAIAFRNRWRREHAPKEISEDIMPSNILMKGSTGTGKTEIARQLAKLCKIPFNKVEATMYTEKGYVGDDTNNIVVGLGKKSMDIVKAEYEEKIKDQALKKVESMLLDIILPVVSDEADTDEKSLNRGTRARFLEKIQKGEMDDSVIEISLEEKAANLVGGMVDENHVLAFQDMLSRFVPKKKKKRKVTLAQAKSLLLRQESDKLLEYDMENIKEEAIRRAENGIVFIDEIDKICATGSKGSGPDVSQEGVQRNLLPIVEGCTVNTRMGPIKTDHILFIAAGAFHNSQPSDLMPEFQGRLPIRVVFKHLTEKDFYRILKEPKNSIIKQQKALFKAEGVLLNFTDEAIRAIAKSAHRLNQEREDIGARRLRTVMTTVLEPFLFQVPDQIKPGTEITIDDKTVANRLVKIMSEEESSKYIL